MTQILVVDDEKKMGILIEGTLKDAGYSVKAITSGEEALELLKKANYDIVITDLKMEPVDGMQVLKKAKELNESTEVIMMTAYATAQSAVQAMKSGAADYIIKPFALEELKLLVDKIVEKQKLVALNLQLQEDLGKATLDEFVGKSEKIKNVFELVEKVAKTDANVLLLGESGTGKELVARAIHQKSKRKTKPLITVNCAALTETLLESELFGHEKGAFTGAYAKKLGRFELADQGTIFLDEIGEISPTIQAKLLRVLEEKKFNRVGGVETIQVNTRVIAATNKNLEESTKQGRFREDLYFRLNVFPIWIPPLRERREDISLLIDYFLKKYNYQGHKLSKDVMEQFINYDWPGNVRELKNILERAIILSDGKDIQAHHIGIKPPSSVSVGSGIVVKTPLGGGIPEPPADLSLGEMEKNMILEALKKSKGNKAEAARALHITRRMLYSRMKKYGLQ
ncbi:MAG: sigma-54-dependent transcriptional regulator [Candidatus Zixiibacteriota bacterium]